MNRIILIGMKASGKTTIGKLLARKLGVSSIELDWEIEKNHEKNKQESLSCRDIFKKYGEKYFRKLETDTLVQLTKTIHETDFVLACGGGTPLTIVNQSMLKKLGKIIFLDVNKKVLLKRIKKTGAPAFFSDKKNLQKSLDKLLQQRLSVYNKLARTVIKIDNETSEEIVDKIMHVRNFVKTDDLERNYMNRINGDTKVIGFLGSTYKASKMYALYNAAFEALKLNYIYVPFVVSDLKRAVEGIRHLGIKAVGVTIPYKIDIIQYLDELDENAKRIGAVNVVINNNGKLIGGNTDGLGGIKALKEKTKIAGKRIILLGAGGAARALASALVDNGSKLLILNRTESDAKKLAKAVRAQSTSLNSLEKEISNADILINATSSGMKPNDNESLVNKRLLHPELVVMDLVTNPRETRLIKDAINIGCKIVYGQRMLFWQAVLKFKLFTGVDAPVESMEKILQLSS